MNPHKECPAPHVALAQRGHAVLNWSAPHHMLERVRPVAWTCACRATVYELCQGGGRAFIRKIVQLDGGPVVHETPCWSIGSAQSVWADLLSGGAR
ncbi:hypothetical protein GCM10017673_54200 [Streptosporangium violaceochromogenes]|nr:hypothetical protein GCM10017673_54200 [Streptosporangium violaceochromogenes]